MLRRTRSRPCPTLLLAGEMTMNHRTEPKSSGFTLIELMTVVAIISILLAIAVPAYNEYINRAHRAAAQQFLLDVAQRQEQYLLDNLAYAGNLGGLGMSIPADIAADYDPLVITLSAPPPSFQLSMAPKAGARMAADGTLVINNRTEKWRDTDGDKKPW